ncbi:MAG: PD-(D/E)XK nuclease domain-containing protein [Acutalibacteraceae bacterium]|nr:PD-(D/E)XK nuclease domain-containing protein [Acutalibacteraceae bacterium]
MSFDEAKQWYDGYSFSKVHSIYNPYSIMKAMKKRVFRSYWQHTSAAENLETLININKDGLQEDILKLVAGEQLVVNTNRFKNDFTSFSSKDDVLTLLIHLGYLVYDPNTKRVRIPNEEVRFEFDELLQNAQHTQLASLISASEHLFKDTLNGNESAVAETIERVRETNYAPMYYNNEQSLRYVIKFAYIICIDYYLKVEELPTGKGIADVVFIPKRDTSLPAMIVELKWNESSESAIKQIKEKNYPAILAGYVGEMILVGINYDEKTKDHSCNIEKIEL